MSFRDSLLVPEAHDDPFFCAPLSLALYDVIVEYDHVRHLLRSLRRNTPRGRFSRLFGRHAKLTKEAQELDDVLLDGRLALKECFVGLRFDLHDPRAVKLKRKVEYHETFANEHERTKNRVYILSREIKQFRGELDRSDMEHCLVTPGNYKYIRTQVEHITSDLVDDVRLLNNLYLRCLVEVTGVQYKEIPNLEKPFVPLGRPDLQAEVWPAVQEWMSNWKMNSVCFYAPDMEFNMVEWSR